MNLPFNAAELSVAALVVFGVIFTIWTAFNKTPGIIAGLDTYRAHRAEEIQEAENADRVAIEAASERRLVTINAQAGLIERQQSLLEQSQAFADRLLSQEEKREKEREDLEAQFAGLRGKYEESLRIEGQVDELRRQIGEDRKRAEDDKKALQEEIRTLRQENQELKNKIADVERERDELSERVKALEAEKAQRNGEATKKVAEEKSE